MKRIFISLLSVVALAVPALALAQTPTPNFTYTDLWIIQVIKISQQAVTFLMVVATLWFIWTVIAYIREKDAKEAANKKNGMLRGIIGLFVIVGIWGIIRIIASTLGVTGGSLPTDQVACPPGMIYSGGTCHS